MKSNKANLALPTPKVWAAVVLAITGTLLVLMPTRLSFFIGIGLIIFWFVFVVVFGIKSFSEPTKKELVPFVLPSDLEEVDLPSDLEVDEPRVLFSTDGKGNWQKCEWKKQCSKKVFGTSCQGVEGHKGVHWCFCPSGSFLWEDNKEDSTEHGCSGSCPPGGKGYKNPLEMRKHYHNSHFTTSEVTDLNEIERLEKGEMRPGESVTRPCSDQDFEKLFPQKRLDFDPKFRDNGPIVG